MSNLHVNHTGDAIEQAAWFGDAMPPWIASGGIPGVPSASLVLAAFATTGYVRGSGGELVYVAQSAATVTLPDIAGIYWLVLHRDQKTVVTDWTRQPGTHYLWQRNATQPAFPTGSMVLARIVVAGSLITTVGDFRRPRSLADRGVYDVTDPLYGAVGDGVTDDTAAIQAAFNAGKTVYFPEGTYFLGSHVLNDNIIYLGNQGDNIRLLTQGNVEILVTAVGPACFPRCFVLEGNSHFSCQPIRFRETGLDVPNATGSIGFYLANGLTKASSNWGNCTFESIHATTMGGALFIATSTPDALTRIRGVHIGTLNADDCYYGFNCQNDGDSVTIDNFTAYHCVRPYYVYGVVGHTVSRLFNRHPRLSTGQCYIQRQVGGLDTRGIAVNYVCRDTDAAFAGPTTHVAIDHIDLLGGDISGITIDVDINQTAVNYYPVKFRNYSGSGGSETYAPSANLTRDIRLSGSCDGNALPIPVVATYAVKRQMHFIPGYNFLPSADLATAFQLTQLSRGVVGGLVWSTSAVQPVLGNGSLTYDVDVTNGLYHLSINLVFGSTTTPGTGEWIFDHFTPNFTATARAQGTWVALDFGTGFYCGTTVIQANSDDIICFVNGGVGALQGTIPFAWTTGDELHLTITFPMS